MLTSVLEGSHGIPCSLESTPCTVSVEAEETCKDSEPRWDWVESYGFSHLISAVYLQHRGEEVRPEPGLFLGDHILK